jgi:hypothetical protein
MQTITYACHTAHLDPMTGEGVLIMPRPSGDLPSITGAGSLHEADWGHVIEHLDGLGWEPAEDDDGGWSAVGTTATGHTVIALYGREPVTTMPSLDESAEALAALARIAGVTERTAA